jgi:hypothetical protein
VHEEIADLLQQLARVPAMEARGGFIGGKRSKPKQPGGSTGQPKGTGGSSSRGGASGTTGGVKQLKR